MSTFYDENGLTLYDHNYDDIFHKRADYDLNGDLISINVTQDSLQTIINTLYDKIVLLSTLLKRHTHNLNDIEDKDSITNHHHYMDDILGLELVVQQTDVTKVLTYLDSETLAVLLFKKDIPQEVKPLIEQILVERGEESNVV